MRADEELRQGLMTLVYRVGCGLATGQPPAGLVDVLDELLPELRRVRGAAWLEQQARTMRPRKVRKVNPERVRRKQLRTTLGLR